MGPRLDSRGRERSEVFLRPDDWASMGPRLDSRGRVPTCNGPDGQLTLQWGRGWTAAEGTHLLLALLPRPRFNGAAAGQPRKGRPTAPDNACSSSASMGPRLDSRGRGANHLREPLWRLASMGPRLDSRGRLWGTGRTDHPPLRFNGAAAGQPRKGAGGSGTTGRRRASMGPRLDSRGRRRRPNPLRLRSRFNGAAAGQPRKGRNPRRTRNRNRLLQWGRGWTAAEG